MFPRGARTLAIEFNKIRGMPTSGICNQIEDTQIPFLINIVANGTRPHIPKPSFNTVPDSSGSFVQMIGRGCVWHVCCSVSNPGSIAAAGTCGCKQLHDASLIGYGQSLRDARDRHGLRCVKCHGSVVGWRRLLTKVVQRMPYGSCVTDVLGVADELGVVVCVVATVVGWYLEFCENFTMP
jgi:hypothetical protein